MKKLVLALVAVMAFAGTARAEEEKNSDPTLPDYTAAPFVRVDTQIEHSGMAEHGNKETVLVETYFDAENEVSALNKIKVYYIIRHIFGSVTRKPFFGELYPEYVEWTSNVDKKVRAYRFWNSLVDQSWHFKEEKDLPNK